MLNLSKKVYTIGTDRRSEEEFIEILLAHGIDCVIDIRRFPSSKLEHFKKDNFQRFLIENKINYLFMGNELGGFRRGGYLEYTRTEEFKKAIEILLDIIVNCRAVIVCAEKFPWKCHRRWVARELRKRGWEVIHLIEKDKVWIPA